MSGDLANEATESHLHVTAMALNVALPEHLRWRDTRRGTQFELLSVTVRLLPDGSLAAKAYGRPVAGGRGAYVSFPVPDEPEIAALIEGAAKEAARRWSAHRGFAVQPARPSADDPPA